MIALVSRTYEIRLLFDWFKYCLRHVSTQLSKNVYLLLSRTVLVTLAANDYFFLYSTIKYEMFLDTMHVPFWSQFRKVNLDLDSGLWTQVRVGVR